MLVFDACFWTYCYDYVAETGSRCWVITSPEIPAKHHEAFSAFNLCYDFLFAYTPDLDGAFSLKHSICVLWQDQKRLAGRDNIEEALNEAIRLPEDALNIDLTEFVVSVAWFVNWVESNVVKVPTRLYQEQLKRRRTQRELNDLVREVVNEVCDNMAIFMTNCFKVVLFWRRVLQNYDSIFNY